MVGCFEKKSEKKAASQIIFFEKRSDTKVQKERTI